MLYACTICGLKEDSCQCARFCTLCSVDYDIRLCEDGCYYCADCREICGFIVEQRPPA